MKPENERAALSVAATLIAQALIVLTHAQDATAAMVKQGLTRLIPLMPGDATPVDHDAFFGRLAELHGREFAEEARDGDKPEQTASSANEEALKQQLSEMRKQQEDMAKRIEELMQSATKPEQKNA